MPKVRGQPFVPTPRSAEFGHMVAIALTHHEYAAAHAAIDAAQNEFSQRGPIGRRPIGTIGLPEELSGWLRLANLKTVGDVMRLTTAQLAEVRGITPERALAIHCRIRVAEGILRGGLGDLQSWTLAGGDCAEAGRNNRPAATPSRQTRYRQRVVAQRRAEAQGVPA